MILPIKFLQEQTVAYSFKEMFETYYPVVCRQILFLVGDSGTAEDLAQETFLKLYHSPPAELTNPGGWLAKVATNLAYNYLRSEKSRLQRDTNHLLLEQERKVVSIEDAFFRNMEIRSVREILDTLPARDRSCLLLKSSGYSYREIAEVIVADVNAVGTILARAQKKFKQAYLDRKGSDQ